MNRPEAAAKLESNAEPEVAAAAPPPREFDALRALIMARQNALPPRLVQIAAYALDNPDEIAFGTAAGIAAKAGVQPSTLVRFSQAIGYRGFSDLQYVFRARLRERVLDYDERLAQMREHGIGASRARLLFDGFNKAAVESLGDSHTRLDVASLERAAALLGAADTLYLIGLRRSFPVTAYMAYVLAKLGIRNILVDGLAGLGAEQIGFISPRDAVIAVSFAPYASQTVALTLAARENSAKIVAITDSAFSPVAAPADEWLEVGEADFEGFRSLSATLALAMTLCVAIAGHRENAPSSEHRSAP